MSTGLTTMPAAAQSTSPLSRVADFVELTKPRIVLMELIAVAAVMHIATGYGAAGSAWSVASLLAVAFGTSLVAGSANSLNQWLERELDTLMSRTVGRPIPSGRVAPNEALAFSMLLLALGEATLATAAGPMPALVALATWVVYVAVYTPLKTRSWINTAVGAVSGAAPLWIGWTAGGGQLTDPMALAAVGVMYLWQFPHFMAIAWICKGDYAAAGYKMSTTLDPSGAWAGWQAVIGSALLLPVSLAPLFFSGTIAAGWYAAATALAGLAMLAASARFLSDRNDRTARTLLRVSLLYVPVWLLALWGAGA